MRLFEEEVYLYNGYHVAGPPETSDDTCNRASHSNDAELKKMLIEYKHGVNDSV